jgi:phosphate transport system substrate-binding protein
MIMKKGFQRVIVFFLCMSLTAALGACGSKPAKENNADVNKESAVGGTGKKEETQDVSGAIRMAGSTSMEKLANAAAEAFMGKYPGVTISPEFIGSSAGIEALTAKTVDIGNASRALSDSEKSAGIVENVVAIDGIAVVVDKNNTVKNLTKKQLFDIYTGATTNWSKLGGKNQPIVVIGRESGSGTRDAFEEILEVKDKCKYANELSSTGAVMAKVASTPGSIGYVSLDVVNDTVNAVSLDGVEPTEEKIKSKEYFLSRPFVMATMGEIAKQSTLVQAFFKFMYSEEGSKLIKDAGLIVPDR